MAGTAFSTALELVRQAFKMTNLLTEFETLSDYRLQEALIYLNAYLAQLAANTSAVTYFNKLEFNTVASKAEYTVAPENADILANQIMRIGEVFLIRTGLQYPLNVRTRENFADFSRFQTTIALPRDIYLINSNTQTTLAFYPIPDQVYPVTAFVKQVFTDLTLESNLDQVAQPLKLHLLFKLAKFLSSQYPTAIWSELQEQLHQEAENAAFNASASHNTIRSTSSLQRRSAGYYGRIGVN